MDSLQIGDWVNVFENPKQIEGVRRFRNGDEVVYYDGDNGSFIKDVTPIPLTSDILEKNGFEVSSEHARYYFEEEGEKYEFVLRKMYFIDNPKVQNGWSFYAFNVITLVDYVHELQHALKLCKIEKEIIL